MYKEQKTKRIHVYNTMLLVAVERRDW